MKKICMILFFVALLFIGITAITALDVACDDEVGISMDCAENEVSVFKEPCETQEATAVSRSNELMDSFDTERQPKFRPSSMADGKHRRHTGHASV